MVSRAPSPADGSVRQRVHAIRGDLTAAERRVARVLLAAYPVAGLETVTELADRAGVSAPTVTRFVTKLGFDGYREFQRLLLDEIQARGSSPAGRYPRVADLDATGVLGRVQDDLQRILEVTFQTVSPAEFDAAVDLLANPGRRVLCGGGRLTDVVARYLHARLHLLRGNVALLSAGPSYRLEELLDIERRDVLVVFDVRRYQREALLLAEAATERGAATVLITDRWLSPAAVSADHVLAHAGETSSPFDSLVGAVAIVEALLGALVARLGDAAAERMAAVETLRDRGAGDATT